MLIYIAAEYTMHMSLFHITGIAQHLSNIEVVLEPVQDYWEQFGMSLGVDQAILSLIKYTPGDSTKYMKQLLETLSIEGRQLQDLEKGLVSIGREDVISGMLIYKLSR